ncbi:MAG: transglutaminase family protein [Planctomycetes bacterium]|nr:transglutaminase family protein [Planctomycetota bacterium]
MNHEPAPLEPSSPSPAQIAAAIALLGDDRGTVRDAAHHRLLRWGEIAAPQLREGAQCEHARTRARCRVLLRALEVRDSLRRFGRLRIGPGSRSSSPVLLEGALLLSNMVRTFVPPAAELGRVLRLEANRLRRDFVGRSLPMCARMLAERLHDEFGLQGGNASVLELDHVLVDRVLHGRIGVPVSLSLIYLLVARWAGLSVAGVALPDHFLVRLHGVRPVLVDPFHGGRTVTKADCARYLRANGHEQIRDHLRDLDDREVLIHYLRSLRRAAKYRGAAEGQQSLGRALELLETS